MDSHQQLQAGSGTAPAGVVRELDDVRNFHDEAYLYLEQALSLEEQGRAGEALPLYERGLHKLDLALAVRSDGVGESWDAARLLQAKMRKMRNQVLDRLETLSKEWAARAEAPRPSDDLAATEASPPSYEEATSGPASEVVASGGGSVGPAPDVKSYRELCNTLGRLDERTRGTAQLPRVSYTEVPAEAEEIFNIAAGVQIFFVSTVGTVSAPSYPNALSIHRLRAPDIAKGSANAPTPQSRQPPAFLQVGEWVYPLHPGLMPLLHTSYGAYMFPDTNSDLRGAAIGLILSEDVDTTTREVFEHLLCELTAYRSEPGTPTSRRDYTWNARSVSRGLVQGAEVVSKGVVAGAQKTSEYVRLAAEKLRANMATEEQPSQVDPRIRTGLRVARNVSGIAVKVSGYLLTKLGEATVALGQQLAPHIRQHGANFYCKAMGVEDPSAARGNIDGVMEVAAGGLKGFSTIYMGLERAANILAESLITETVQTVNHKYGSQAADTTDNALHSVGNVAMATHNVTSMGIKGVAKRAAKDTGKAVVQQHLEEIDKDGQGTSKGGKDSSVNGDAKDV